VNTVGSIFLLAIGAVLFGAARPLGVRAEAWHRRVSRFGGPARVYEWGFRLAGAIFLVTGVLGLTGLVKFKR
jgi:hypothetical protein